MSMSATHSRPEESLDAGTLVRAAVPVLVAVAAVGLALATLRQEPAAADAAVVRAPAEPTAYSEMHARIPEPPGGPEEQPATF